MLKKQRKKAEIKGKKKVKRMMLRILAQMEYEEASQKNLTIMASGHMGMEDILKLKKRKFSVTFVSLHTRISTADKKYVWR